MKKWKAFCITVMAAAVLTFGSSCIALAAETGEIHVSGEGVVLAEPDLASIDLNIETTAKTSGAAQEENNRIVKKVTKSMTDMGIAADKIVTNYTSVYPSYSYDDKTGKRRVEAYCSNTSLKVTTKDIDNAGKYIDAALKAGATGTNGVSFSVENQNTYYTQALQTAIKNAAVSAQAIAEAYGRPLGQVTKVVENSSNATYTTAAKMARGVTEEMAMDSSAGSNSTSISYDKIQITADISVTYSF